MSPEGVARCFFLNETFWRGNKTLCSQLYFSNFMLGLATNDITIHANHAHHDQHGIWFLLMTKLAVSGVHATDGTSG